MDSRCYSCDYYDELVTDDDEYPLCQCPKEDMKPEWCSERGDTDGNS